MRPYMTRYNRKYQLLLPASCNHELQSHQYVFPKYHDAVTGASSSLSDFPPCVWATHRLGGIVASVVLYSWGSMSIDRPLRTLSPSLSVGELGIRSFSILTSVTDF